MIRVHDLIAINPDNVVYLEKMNDHVYILLWNGKGHRVYSNTATLSELFTYLVRQFSKEIHLFTVRPFLVVNADAVVSIGKVAVGVAVNLIVENQKTGTVVYAPCKAEDKEREFCRIMSAIDSNAIPVHAG